MWPDVRQLDGNFEFSCRTRSCAQQGMVQPDDLIDLKKIAGVKSITGRRSEANKGAFGGATTRAFSSTGQFAARGKSFSWTPAGVSIKKDGTRAVIEKKPYA